MYAVMTAEPLESEDLIAPPSPELLRHYGSSEVAMRRLRSRPHQQLILRQTTLEDAAFAIRDARIDALLLAEENDGVVIDLSIPRVVELRSDEVSLAHATQWYTVDYQELSDGRFRTRGPEVVRPARDRGRGRRRVGPRDVQRGPGRAGPPPAR